MNPQAIRQPALLLPTSLQYSRQRQTSTRLSRGQDLRTHPLAIKLESNNNSPDFILDVFRKQASGALTECAEDYYASSRCSILPCNDRPRPSKFIAAPTRTRSTARSYSQPTVLTSRGGPLKCVGCPPKASFHGHSREPGIIKARLHRTVLVENPNDATRHYRCRTSHYILGSLNPCKEQMGARSAASPVRFIANYQHPVFGNICFSATWGESLRESFDKVTL